MPNPIGPGRADVPGARPLPDPRGCSGFPAVPLRRVRDRTAYFEECPEARLCCDTDAKETFTECAQLHDPSTEREAACASGCAPSPTPGTPCPGWFRRPPACPGGPTQRWLGRSPGGATSPCGSWASRHGAAFRRRDGAAAAAAGGWGAGATAAAGGDRSHSAAATPLRGPAPDRPGPRPGARVALRTHTLTKTAMCRSRSAARMSATRARICASGEGCCWGGHRLGGVPEDGPAVRVARPPASTTQPLRGRPAAAEGGTRVVALGSGVRRCRSSAEQVLPQDPEAGPSVDIWAGMSLLGSCRQPDALSDTKG